MKSLQILRSFSEPSLSGLVLFQEQRLVARQAMFRRVLQIAQSCTNQENAEGRQFVALENVFVVDGVGGLITPVVNLAIACHDHGLKLPEGSG